METKHTPGPWYFGRMQGWGSVCILRRPAADYGPQGVIGDAPIAQLVEKAPGWENSYPMESNARLMAAAPELMEVVSDWFFVMEDKAREEARDPTASRLWRNRLEKARAAYAKATGAA